MKYTALTHKIKIEYKEEAEGLKLLTNLFVANLKVLLRFPNVLFKCIKLCPLSLSLPPPVQFFPMKRVAICARVFVLMLISFCVKKNSHCWLVYRNNVISSVSEVLMK